MSFFNSNAILDGGEVKNASITLSSLDMNYQKITSVDDPIDDYDAVNKRYISNTLGIKLLTISLSGTIATQILNDTYGSFHVIVKSSVNNPTATFLISKSIEADNGNIQRISNAKGNIANERLEIVWPPNSGVSLYKTGINHDGNYNVKIY